MLSASIVSGDMLESFFNLLQSGQVTTAKKVVSEDLDISWATKVEEAEELTTRSCHLAIKNFCPVASWCRFKKSISDPDNTLKQYHSPQCR